MNPNSYGNPQDPQNQHWNFAPQNYPQYQQVNMINVCLSKTNLHDSSQYQQPGQNFSYPPPANASSYPPNPPLPPDLPADHSSHYSGHQQQLMGSFRGQRNGNQNRGARSNRGGGRGNQGGPQQSNRGRNNNRDSQNQGGFGNNVSQYTETCFTTRILNFRLFGCIPRNKLTRPCSEK